MNRILKKIVGVIVVIIGSKFLIDALFYPESDVMNSFENSIGKAIFLIIGVVLIIVAYYFCFRTSKV
ncbi:hypothetical protein NMT12_40104 [metagenome]